MTIWRLVFSEILHRRMNFALGVLSVMVASASFIGSVTLLNIHDIRTNQILQDKQDELADRMVELTDVTRKAMLKLGFNVVILPKDQNLADWYADDYASKYMSEDYVHRLADSGIVTVRHFLPSLQQKIEWPEQKRKVILVGTRGEVPNLHKNPVKPMVQPVPPGTISLGHELHRSMNIKVGDKVTLMERQFTVHACHEERGNKDDITAWIYLAEAQELLDKKGLINAILALECLCTTDALPIIRKEIAAILPGTQVIERGSRALVRAEARNKVEQEARVAIEKEKLGRQNLRTVRERLASILTPVIVMACAVWIVLLGFTNVRARREEIGVLRTLGVSAKGILVMFLSRHVMVGVLGGALGFCAGVLAAVYFGAALEDTRIGITDMDLSLAGLLVLSVGGAAVLAVIAGWIPTLTAIRQDPAEVLREE
ncbi:MAG: ABC transporter permease [Planctomycetes bacterium]|nr:ABC transporter permease [Planctomycetota bacterium]MBL7146737.1 ABC transporter permease [Phycisphaerae bacterium]